MRPNTNSNIPEHAAKQLLELLDTRGYVRIGCGAPAVGFARYAEAQGRHVTVEVDPDVRNMMRITKED